MLGIVAIVIFGPTIVWRIYSIRRSAQATGEKVSKPFVCPNCGNRFYTQQKIIFHTGEDKAFLKCPKCGKRDSCGRPYDLD